MERVNNFDKHLKPTNSDLLKLCHAVVFVVDMQNSLPKQLIFFRTTAIE